ncbi:hypothetical protein GOBAR_AA21947 [Gossypium barbadense]|uniref:Uncharacterized protein n=1 Tax=Gossypium barbadense TaxID=3634 RepID=A0A2P5X5Z4_GOSBA|nr:hypothetical protein GOBAR_AA21947 [Gossypium barbadense]
MKVAKEWRLGSMGDTKILPGSRHRSPLKRPIWIILMVSFVSLFLVCAYIYPPNSDVACYVFSSRGCKVLTDWLPPPRKYCLLDWSQLSLLMFISPFADGKNCIADEHYLPTFFNLVDPGGIANWSVTRVDWSERKWHPKSYRAQDVTYDLLRNFTSIDMTTHITSNAGGEELLQPCIWNGTRRPCYLFARKFYPETLDKLVTLLNF